jgi:TP901 family phage tail tape measure protein
MSTRTETLQLRVVIDGTPARRELATLDQEYAKLNAGLKDLKKNSTEYVNSTARMDEVRKRQQELRQEIGMTSLTAKQLGDELRRLQIAQRNATPNTAQWAENAARIEQVKARLKELNDVNVRAAAAWEVQRRGMQLTNMTMEQLEQEAARLRTALRTMDPNSGEFRNLNRELLQVDDRMKALRNNLTPMQALWRNVKQEMSGVLGLTAGLFAGGIVVSKIQEWVKASGDLSDAQADVRKTTGITQVEVEELTRKLGQLNTRTARSELLELAREAGKLGRAKEEILGFVRAGDQINVALGEDLGEGAIKTIGKLTEQFKVTSREGYDLERSMLAIGSAVNELGASSTADEGFLVDFTSRMAGVNTQANISIESTLGYAAALDQLGQRSETSSTALAQFTLKAFTSTAEYAKIAGMGVEEFTALLNTDTNEALLRTLEGLNGNNEGLDRMTGLFGDLGQEGARAVGVLASLASNTKMVREQQTIANKAMADATSVTNEFNTKNNTLAADLEIIGKRLASFFVNSGVVNGIRSMVGGLRDLVEVPVSATLEEERFEMMKLHAQILSTNVGSEERVKLINELQAKYPGYLGNLDAETVSNQELSNAVADLNKQLVNKIILQQKDEDIQDQIERQAEYQMEVLEQEDVVRGRLVKLAEEYNLKIKEGVPLIEQSKDLSQQIEEIRKRTFNTGGGIVFDQVARFRKSIAELEATYGHLNAQQNVSNRLAEERTALLARLGIEERKVVAAATGEVTPAGTPSGGTGDTGDEKAEAEKEKLRQRLEEMRAELEEHRERMFQDGLSAEERDLRQLDLKHANELAKLRANALATDADLRALEEAQRAERVDLIEAQGDERLQGYSEAAERIRQATLDDATLQLEAELKKWDELILLARKYGVDTAQLEEARRQAEAAIRKKWADKGLADEKKNNEDALRAYRESMQRRIEMMQGFAQLAGSITSIYDALKSVEEQRADADGVRTQQEMQRIDAIEKKRRVAALAQIVVSSATGVAQAISAGAGIPFPGNLAAIAAGVAAVLSGIASAYSLLNSSNNRSQQNTSNTVGSGPTSMPTGAKGGIFEGPSHDNGGLQVWDPSTGRQVAEVEGGEPWMVLSKAFRRNNAGLIPALLNASATGSRVDLAARGGIFGPTPRFNFTAANEAVKLAAGGMMDGNNRVRRVAGMATDNSGGDAGEAMLSELRAMNGRLAAIEGTTAAWPTTIKAVASVQDMNRRQAELVELQDRNRVRKVA